MIPDLDRSLRTLLALAVGAALVGCGKNVDERHLARRHDLMASAGPSRPEAPAEPARGARDTGETTRQVAAEIRSASKDAADQATNKVADAIITTSVSAELAKDARLSSTHVEVDTDNGRVALRGTAPDAAARERATQLARSVQGVVSVDNQMVVGRQG